MDKKEVLLYGALLESNIRKDEYGDIDEDVELLQKALKKNIWRRGKRNKRRDIKNRKSNKQ